MVSSTPMAAACCRHNIKAMAVREVSKLSKRSVLGLQSASTGDVDDDEYVLGAI